MPTKPKVCPRIMAYPAASRIFPNEAIKVALAESITSGAFTDTGYMLYSRRLANGGAGAPRRVYACSAVLKAAGEYFSARTSVTSSILPATDQYFLELDGGFSTNETLPDKIESYGYESDSDLDDTEDLEPSAEFEHEGELAQESHDD